MEEAGRILLINNRRNNYKNNHLAKLKEFSKWSVNTIPDNALVQSFVEPLITQNNIIIKAFAEHFDKPPLETTQLTDLKWSEKDKIRNQLKNSYSQISRIIVFLRPKFLYVDVENNNNDLIVSFLSFANQTDGIEAIRKFYRNNVLEFLNKDCPGN